MSELSADAKSLIERTRFGDAPSAEDKDRIRSRLGAQLGAGAFTGAALATSGMVQATPAASATTSAAPLASGAGKGLLAGALKMGALRWVAALVTTGGLAVGAYVVNKPVQPPQATTPPVAAAARVAQPEPVAPAQVDVPPAPLPEATLEQPPAQKPEPKRRKPAVRGAAAVVPVANTSTMGEEIALLGRAQKALRQRDGKEALRLTRQHAESFPSGALYEERLGIEALAHCIDGERSHPSVRAFLARSPRSPLLARVQKECTP